MTKISSLLLLSLCLLPCLSSVGADAPVYSERADAVLREVWDTVARGHYDRDFKINNRALYDRHKSDILKSPDDGALAEAINRLLSELGDSHIALLVPLKNSGQKALKELQQIPMPRRGDAAADPGFTVLASDQGMLITHVRPELQKDNVILPGDELVEIDGVRIDSSEPIKPSWGILTRALLMRGAPESIAQLTVRRDGLEYPVRLPRKPNGGEFFQLGTIPQMTALYASELRTDNIAVIRFNLFVPENIKKFRRDIRNKLKDADALIIDLRGNPGGILLTAEWLAAWSSSEEIPLGTMTIDGTRLAPGSTPQRRAFPRPIAVLIDRDSCSTSEVFAAAMQDAGAAIIVGEKSPGLCLPSQIVNLKSGFRLQTIAGNIQRANGNPIEGVGVTPDHNVSLSAVELRKGIDTPLEFAAKLLKKQ